MSRYHVIEQNSDLPLHSWFRRKHFNVTVRLLSYTGSASLRRWFRRKHFNVTVPLVDSSEVLVSIVGSEESTLMSRYIEISSSKLTMVFVGSEESTLMSRYK